MPLRQLLASALLLLAAPLAAIVPASAGTDPDAESVATIAGAAEEQLLGSARAEQAQDEQGAADLLPFTREFTVRGHVGDDLLQSIADAGVPAAALLEPAQALASRLDLARELVPTDRFRVRWQQTFNGDGQPIGEARVVALDLATAGKGKLALSRFRAFAGPTAGGERFFFADGTLGGPAPIRLPLDRIQVTSGFGLRADPLDQPARSQPVVAEAPAAVEPSPPPRSPDDLKAIARAHAGFGNGEQFGSARNLNPGFAPGFGPGTSMTTPGTDLDRIMAERRIRAREEEALRKAEQEVEAERKAAAERLAAQRAAEPPGPRKPTILYMHEGLDLLADIGTPIHAAADGIVTLARRDRGYGNAIHLEHAGRLATIYGHLAGFAPGLEPGVAVRQGEIIGFVGATGRSTGAHLHFEFLVGGRPVDPNTGTQAVRLGALDLARFKRQLALDERLHPEPRKDDQPALARPSQLAKAL